MFILRSLNEGVCRVCGSSLHPGPQLLADDGREGVGAFLLPQCPEALINLRSEGAEPVLQLLDWTGLG